MPNGQGRDESERMVPRREPEAPTCKNGFHPPECPGDMEPCKDDGLRGLAPHPSRESETRRELDRQRVQAERLSKRLGGGLTVAEAEERSMAKRRRNLKHPGDCPCEDCEHYRDSETTEGLRGMEPTARTEVEAELEERQLEAQRREAAGHAADVPLLDMGHADCGECEAARAVPLPPLFTTKTTADVDPAAVARSKALQEGWQRQIAGHEHEYKPVRIGDPPGGEQDPGLPVVDVPGVRLEGVTVAVAAGSMTTRWSEVDIYPATPGTATPPEGAREEASPLGSVPGAMETVAAGRGSGDGAAPDHDKPAATGGWLDAARATATCGGEVRPGRVCELPAGHLGSEACKPRAPAPPAGRWLREGLRVGPTCTGLGSVDPCRLDPEHTGPCRRRCPLVFGGERCSRISAHEGGHAVSVRICGNAVRGGPASCGLPFNHLGQCSTQEEDRERALARYLSGNRTLCGKTGWGSGVQPCTLGQGHDGPCAEWRPSDAAREAEIRSALAAEDPRRVDEFLKMPLDAAARAEDRARTLPSNFDGLVGEAVGLGAAWGAGAISREEADRQWADVKARMTVALDLAPMTELKTATEAERVMGPIYPVTFGTTGNQPAGRCAKTRGHEDRHFFVPASLVNRLQTDTPNAARCLELGAVVYAEDLLQDLAPWTTRVDGPRESAWHVRAEKITRRRAEDQDAKTEAAAPEQGWCCYLPQHGGACCFVTLAYLATLPARVRCPKQGPSVVARCYGPAEHKGACEHDNAAANRNAARGPICGKLGLPTPRFLERGAPADPESRALDREAARARVHMAIELIDYGQAKAARQVLERLLTLAPLKVTL